MKIETLKTGKFTRKKPIIIGGTLFAVVLVVTLTVFYSYAKYRVTQSIDLASGTINYKAPDFQIMAMYKSEDGKTYTEMAASERMPSSGYVIDESKSYCNLNGSEDKTAVLKTIDGNHVISNLIKGDKCYLYFKKGGSYAADVILANLGTSIKTSTPTFSTIATSDEGVYSTSDGMYSGTTYYWRGAASTNYVKFAGFCWRIIRINGDKTIRMIYDGSTCHTNGTSTTDSLAQPTSGTTTYRYNASYNQSNYVGWTYSGSSQRPSETNNDGSVGTASNAKTQLQTWYNANLASYAGKIADGKYCNDRNAQSGNTWAINGGTFYYAAYKRIYTDYSPTFSCSNAGDVYTLKVGLITADEVMFAGGKGENNTSYYLYNGNHYWTMSPFSWYSSGYASVFYVSSSGDLDRSNVDWTDPGLRPVINLKADTTFASGGTGTQSNPYVVS